MILYIQYNIILNKMTAINYISDTYQDLKDSIKYHVKFSNPISILTSIKDYFHNIERGTEFPEYLPYVSVFTKHIIDSALNNLANFVRIHEPELNLEGKKDWTYYKRLEYFFYHFHIYNNETMRNIYYMKKIQKSQINRITYNYNVAHFSWLLYNTLSGTAIIALTSYFFKNKTYCNTFRGKYARPFIATIPLYLALYLNYHISDLVKVLVVNNCVRRHGHGDLICRKFERYPKNTEYTKY